MLKSLRTAHAAAMTLFLVGAAASLHARADELAVRNVQMVQTRHDSFIAATVVNTSGFTISQAAIAFDVEGEEVVVTTEGPIENGDAWRIWAKSPKRASRVSLTSADTH